jgi:DNA repair exonuclease SbcCD ATPase subunit
MTKSLYSLSEEATRLEAQIREQAELLFSDDPTEADQARQQLEALLSDEADTREALQRKADAWCWVIDRARATAAERKAHAQRLAELAAADEAKADRLQDQLVSLLLRAQPDATSFELPDHKLTSRRSVAVELDPDLLPCDLPEAYQRSKTTVSADKTALKAALTAGATIPGAQLVERRSWRLG